MSCPRSPPLPSPTQGLDSHILSLPASGQLLAEAGTCTAKTEFNLYKQRPPSASSQRSTVAEPGVQARGDEMLWPPHREGGGPHPVHHLPEGPTATMPQRRGLPAKGLQPAKPSQGHIAFPVTKLLGPNHAPCGPVTECPMRKLRLPDWGMGAQAFCPTVPPGRTGVGGALALGTA